MSAERRARDQLFADCASAEEHASGLRLSRRGFIKGVASASAIAAAGWPHLPLARSDGEERLVVVVLRGGMDGLTAVMPYGDPSYESARKGLAEPGPVRGEAQRLDDVFALHPALGFMAELHGRGELVAIHAVAPPYRARSHFDGQNVLETGVAGPFSRQDGWLGRSLAARSGAGARRPGSGLAIGPTLPLVLRGPVPASSWSPSPLAAPGESLLARLQRVYADDPTLDQALARAISSHDIAKRVGRFDDPIPFVDAARAAGVFLRESAGARVAALDFGGWDTHAYQDLPFGALPRCLGALDRGLRGLASELGPLWRQTAVLVVTEFGRTVAMNGSHGTDHGTGGAAFLVGGAVAGGRVVTDWPGLRASDLHEGRDLRATLDLRSVLKGVLHDHLKVSRHKLARDVFPDSTGAPLLEGLIRPT